MTNKKNVSDKDFSEMRDLIQKEKEEALQSFRKQDFGSKLNERIEAEKQKPSHDIFWFRKPVIAVGMVLIVVVIGWVTAQFLLTPSYEMDAEVIEKALTLASNSYGFMKEQSVPIDPQPALEYLYEIEWYAKSVVYSNRRENIPDEDMPQIFSQVLQNGSLMKTEEEKGSEDIKFKKRTQSLKKESDLYHMLSQI
jgi:hypothetical protein